MEIIIDVGASMREFQQNVRWCRRMHRKLERRAWLMSLPEKAWRVLQ
jgi:hypothetical protein